MTTSFCPDEVIYQDRLIATNFTLHKKIGQGCFGKVFQAFNIKTRQLVALKFESAKKMDELKTQKYALDIQYRLLKSLQDVEGVPKVHSKGFWEYGKYLEIELLSHNLSHLANTDSEVSPQELQSIAKKIVKIFRQIHGRGVIHRDLKPQNFMENKKGELFIIDFGIGKMLQKGAQTSTHKRGFVGTPRYASIAAHSGQQQGPKQDIQSFLYVLAHFQIKNLPWMKLPQSSARLDNIRNIKQSVSERLFQEIGSNFLKAYKYIRGLDFQQKVNYEFLIQLLSEKKSKTIKIDSPVRKKDKKHSLEVQPFINMHRFPGRQRKFSVSTIKEVISFSQATKNSIGTIVINWVKKQQLRKVKTPSKSRISQNKASPQDDGSSKVNYQDSRDVCGDLEQDLNELNDQPPIRIAQHFSTSLNPFTDSS